MQMKTYFQQECPACRRSLRVAVEDLGRKITCEFCGEEVLAKDSEEDSRPPPEIPEVPLLIVHNDPVQLQQLTRRFAQLGFFVIHVHHPRMALEAASSRPFRVAIIGGALAELTGTELAGFLRRRVRDLRVILLGDDSGTARSSAGAEGIWRCLEQSASLDELEACVDEALEAWQVTAEARPVVSPPPSELPVNALP